MTTRIEAICAPVGRPRRGERDTDLRLGLDEQPRPYSTEQRRVGISAIHATAIDRVRGELQPASPPPWSSISESLQIDRL